MEMKMEPLEPDLSHLNTPLFSPNLSQFKFKANRRAHTLEKRRIGLKLRPLVLHTPVMITLRITSLLIITKRNISKYQNNVGQNQALKKKFN